ncbi:hypothetical protein JMJ35_008453 [Cladonia borealis]|uniref:Uncharacterized protein n=1 Tax=Cladonia borealis TaxID=184061 RepID=A0AA39UYY2_9LECA|nr:hypothetical protein JMJ35_008453 [Cladonia borealis]
MSMAESKKELSKRLEPSRRQFFQWHYREGEPIRRIKEKMDELSYHLKETSDFDFRADEGTWRYRAREWNKAWGIKKGERGLHQPIPGNVSHLPIWQTEMGDVGHWRATTLSVNDESHPTLSPAEQDLQTSQATQGFGFWNARKISHLERPLHDVCSQSSAATSASFISTQSPYSPIVNIGNEHRAFNTAEIAQWTNSITPPFTDIHPPMLPYEDQDNNNLQYHTQAYSEPYGSNHTTVATLATGPASAGYSTDAIYASNNYPTSYEGGNIPLTRTPCSTISMEFESMTPHIHGYRQPSHVHGQAFAYGTQKNTFSAQSCPIHADNPTTPSYDEESASQDHEASQTLY